jgi:putative NADPH-quinone reductase
MRILTIFCHPSLSAYSAALLRSATRGLTDRGHEVVVRDLYREEFQPVLSEPEFSAYRERGPLPADIATHAEELQNCEGLLLIYPSWWYGPPAMLKGYFDRVWLPGVAFRFDDAGRIRPRLLTNIRRFAVVTTYGSPWSWINLAVGNPGKRMLIRGLRHHFSKDCRISWSAHYDMDVSSPEELQRFCEGIERKLTDFF